MRNSRNVLLAVVLCILMVLEVTVILAFGLRNKKLDNEVNIGQVNISVVREDKETNNHTINSEIKIHNDGPNDCYVRIRAVFDNPEMNRIATVNWDTINFEYNENDNFWYYKFVLKAGENTPTLYSAIEIEPNVDMNELPANELLVYTEAYQADSFEDYTEAWNDYVKNKPVEEDT